jgi:hypothetical protein
MAATPVTGSTGQNINDPLTEQVWSKTFFKFALSNMTLTNLMNKKQGSPILKVEDLTTSKGGSITMRLDAPLTTNGVTDNDRFVFVDGSNTFNTEAMKNYNYTVTVHERGNSVAQAGRGTNQLSAMDVKQSGLERLGVWMGEAIEDDLISAGSSVGNTEQTGAARVGNSGTPILTVKDAVPTQNRYYAIGENTTTGIIQYCKIDGTATSLITGVANLPANSFSADAQGAETRFSTKVIEFLHRKAREVIEESYGGTTLKVSKVAPVKVNGKSKYVCIISRLQEKSLLEDDRWVQAQRLAGPRTDKNNLFTGEIGEWNGVVIQVSERIHYRVGAGGVTTSEYFNEFDSGAGPDAVASGVQMDRGMFMGVSGIMIAFAQMPTKTYDKEDVNTIDTVAVWAMYGVGKPQFSYWNTTNWQTGAGSNDLTEDYGCINFDTVVDPD